MFKLLKKEMSLTASILSYLFLAFALMTFIPNYPILMGAFFICFGIFYTFQKAREANDILYTTILPVKKTDIVKAKYVFTVFIQLLGFAACAVLAVIRLLLLNGHEPYASVGALMNSNLAYLGYVLLVYTGFNVLFVGGFFRTSYKIGIPFLLYAISAFAVIILGEGLHFIPGLEVLNYDYHYSHIIMLALCALIYAGATLLSEKLSEKRFLKTDL